MSSLFAAAQNPCFEGPRYGVVCEPSLPDIPLSDQKLALFLCIRHGSSEYSL